LDRGGRTEEDLISGTLAWRFGSYVLAGTIRQFGTQKSLLLTLTEIETGTQVWNGRQRPPFEGLVQAFDNLASQLARRDRVELISVKNGLSRAAPTQEQDEQLREVREQARLTHNVTTKRAVRRVGNRKRKAR
jgi:hypothetical protein